MTLLSRSRLAAALSAALLLGGSGCADGPEATDATAAKAKAAAPAPRDEALERYLTDTRAELTAGKVGIYNRVMSPSPEESKVFWPIYFEYEEELFALGDRRVDLLARYAAVLAAGQIDQKAAGELAGGYLAFEADRVELLKRYHDTITKAMSPVRAAQFLQIEHRMLTVIDLSIAAGLPAIRTAPAAR